MKSGVSTFRRSTVSRARCTGPHPVEMWSNRSTA